MIILGLNYSFYFARFKNARYKNLVVTNYFNMGRYGGPFKAKYLLVVDNAHCNQSRLYITELFKNGTNYSKHFKTKRFKKVKYLESIIQTF